MREAIIQKVLDKKVIAIVRGVYGEDALAWPRLCMPAALSCWRSPSTRASPKA